MKMVKLLLILAVSLGSFRYVLSMEDDCDEFNNGSESKDECEKDYDADDKEKDNKSQRDEDSTKITQIPPQKRYVARRLEFLCAKKISELKQNTDTCPKELQEYVETLGRIDNHIQRLKNAFNHIYRYLKQNENMVNTWQVYNEAPTNYIERFIQNNNINVINEHKLLLSLLIEFRIIQPSEINDLLDGFIALITKPYRTCFYFPINVREINLFLRAIISQMPVSGFNQLLLQKMVLQAVYQKQLYLCYLLERYNLFPKLDVLAFDEGGDQDGSDDTPFFIKLIYDNISAEALEMAIKIAEKQNIPWDRLFKWERLKYYSSLWQEADDFYDINDNIFSVVLTGKRELVYDLNIHEIPKIFERLLKLAQEKNIDINKLINRESALLQLSFFGVFGKDRLKIISEIVDILTMHGAEVDWTETRCDSGWFNKTRILGKIVYDLIFLLGNVDFTNLSECIRLTRNILEKILVNIDNRPCLWFNLFVKQTCFIDLANLEHLKKLEEWAREANLDNKMLEK